MFWEDKDKNIAIQIMVHFVEGRIDILHFKDSFCNNSAIQTILDKHCRKQDNIRYGREVIPFLKKLNVLSAINASFAFHTVRLCLEQDGIPFVATTFYDERLFFILDILPSWLNMQDETFIESEIINKIPAELKSKTARVKWCKERIKQFFRYDKTPPRWAQHSEWPIGKNGMPMVFKKQSKEDKNSELVKYYFYDPETNEEHTVEQFY